MKIFGKMKIGSAGLALVLVVVVLSGCSGGDKAGPGGRVFSAVNGPFEMDFPEGWYENEKEHPFDLQCFSEFERMNTAVFLFVGDDMAEDADPFDLFYAQIEDMESKRENWTVLEDVQVANLSGKTLTSVVYAGEKGSSRYYYRFTLIEFDEDPDLVPVVIQISLPSYWERNKPVLEAITASGRRSS